LFGSLLLFGLALLFLRGSALRLVFGSLLLGCSPLGFFSRLLLLRRRALGLLFRCLLLGGGAFRLLGGLLFLGLALLFFLGGALSLVLLLLLEQQFLLARLALAGAFLGNLERLHQGIGQRRRRDQRGRQDRERHGCKKSGAESHRFVLTVSRLVLKRGAARLFRPLTCPSQSFQGLAFAALTPPERRLVRREIGRARRPARGGA